MTLIKSNEPYISEVESVRDNMGKSIRLSGFVHRVRDMGEFAFIILRTPKSLIQCVYQPDICKTDGGTVKDGCCIEITGVAVEESRAMNGFEIRLDAVKILSTPYEELPVALGKKYLNISLDTDLSLRQITLRSPSRKAIFSVSSGIERAFCEYLRANGFIQIHSPKIALAGAEGGANMFKVDYFGTDAYLTQSPQIYKQMCAGAFGRVFEVGAVYRAEKHNTSRHLNEYTGLDFEMGFINGMQDIMEIETGMLWHIIDVLENEYKDEFEILGAKLPKKAPIPSLTFEEAKQILKSEYNSPSKNKFDLDPNEEQLLCRYAEEKHGSEFIFITHFPSSKRPFYAMDDPENPKLALSFDLLFRGLEITTGGQRIHDYEQQVEKIKRHGLKPEDFESYLMMHKYGMPPHGGLGIGLERLVMKFLDLSNVREASLFPRDMTRLVP